MRVVACPLRAGRSSWGTYDRPTLARAACGMGGQPAPTAFLHVFQHLGHATECCIIATTTATYRDLDRERGNSQHCAQAQVYQVYDVSKLLNDPLKFLMLFTLSARGLVAILIAVPVPSSGC